ncbi:hypothetical protein C0J52_19683 [Blattella germanica]|nr:hypothetical protein C0J52_19683 [Blattella germanica]
MKVIVPTSHGWTCQHKTARRSSAVNESSVPSTSASETFPNKNRTPLNWTSNLTFKKLEQFSSSAGVIHSLSVGSPEIDYFSLFVNPDFFDYIAAETNKYAIQCQCKKRTLPTGTTMPKAQHSMEKNIRSCQNLHTVQCQKTKNSIRPWHPNTIQMQAMRYCIVSCWLFSNIPSRKKC